MITHDIYINRMEVVPSIDPHTNVVSRVHWEIIFTDGEFTSNGSGITTLDTTNLAGFTPAEQLTEAQVAAWVRADLAARGFEQELIEYHSAAIANKQALKQLVHWGQPLLEQKTRPTVSVVTMRA